MITKEYLQQELEKRIDGYKRGVATTTDNIIAEMKSILVLVNGLEDNKYNDALKRAEVAYKDTDKHIKATIERIFPELRESEDERIRKKLVWLLQQDICPFPEEEVAQMLNYLEKQKDAFENGRQLGIMQEQARQELEWTDEKQKEQKSAWSEEDEKMIDTIVSVLGQYIDYKAVSGTGTEYATPRYSKEIDWLDNLRPQPHWKPSKKQMKELKDASAVMKCDSDNAAFPSLKTLYEQLKKL